MPSRDVNAAMRLAEASWRRDKESKTGCAIQVVLLEYVTMS